MDNDIERIRESYDYFARLESSSDDLFEREELRSSKELVGQTLARLEEEDAFERYFEHEQFEEDHYSEEGEW